MDRNITTKWIRRRGRTVAACLAALIAGCGGGGSGTSGTDSPEPVPPAQTVMVRDESFTIISGEPIDVVANDLVDGQPVLLEPLKDANATLTWQTPPGAVSTCCDKRGLTFRLLPGTWRLPYTLCAIAKPGRCADGVATLVVRLGTLVARDDTITAWIGGSVPNVLANDEETLEPEVGQPLVVGRDTVVRPLAPLPPGIDLSASGQLAVFEGVALDVAHAIDYEVCARDDASNCARARATVTVPGGGLVVGHTDGSTIDLVSLPDTVATTQASGSCGQDAGDGCGLDYTLQVSSPGTRMLVDRGTGLPLPFDRIDSVPGRVLEARFHPDAWQYLTPQPGNQIKYGEFTWSWTEALDEAGQSQPGVKAAIGNLAPFATEFPIVGSTERHAQWVQFILHARFADDRVVTRLNGGTVVMSYGRATPDPWLDAFLGGPLQVYRFDVDAGGWVVAGPATFTVDDTTVRVEAGFDRPGLWSIGRGLPAVRLTGCAVDGDGRPAPYVGVGALSLVTRAATATDSQGRFALDVPADTALELGVIDRELDFLDLKGQTRSVGPFGQATDLGSCLQVPAPPRLAIDFDAIRTREADGSQEAVYAYPAIDAPDGTRAVRGTAIARPLVGTYRVHMPRLNNNLDASPPPITLTMPGRAPLTARLVVDPPSDTRYWHLYDIDVDATCAVTLRRVGKSLTELPALVPQAAVACTPPVGGARAAPKVRPVRAR